MSRDLGAVDRASSVPPFRQIAMNLTRLIETGDLAVGDRLPSEPQLSSHYGVARMTVRQALELLKADALVVSEQGRGVFVADASPLQKLPYFAMPDSPVRLDGNFPLPEDSRGSNRVVVRDGYRVEGANDALFGVEELVIMLESQFNGLAYALHEYRVSPVGELDERTVERAIQRLREEISLIDECHVRLTSRAALPHEARRLGLRTSETVTVTVREGGERDRPLVHCTSVVRGRLPLEYEFRY